MRTSVITSVGALEGFLTTRGWLYVDPVGMRSAVTGSTLYEFATTVAFNKGGDGGPATVETEQSAWHLNHPITLHGTAFASGSTK